MKKLLYPFSIIYNSISKLNRKFTKTHQLKIPVISVGNITWGGSGKTPIVREIANYILSLGKTPVILSRGYGRKNKSIETVIVRDKEKILSDLSVSGDEPYMMAQDIKCPVIVGKDRLQSSILAQQFSPDVFILDDGFQHWKLKRDLDIVCINSLNPFGNGLIIPAGILREKLVALKRADIVILTNCTLCNEDKLEELNKKIIDITGKQPLRSSYDKMSVTNMYNNALISMEELQKKHIFVLSAIGSPDNFINTVINLGLKIKQEIIFQDHHKYNQKEMKNIFKDVEEDDVIITTQKDAVKLNIVVNDALKKKIFILNIAVVFELGNEILKHEINKILL